MPLMRYVEYIIWNSQSVQAGGISPEQDVSRLNRFSVFVNVSTATTITMQYQIFDLWIDRETMNFSGAGINWWIVWADNPKKIRFKTSNAATITITIIGKC